MIEMVWDGHPVCDVNAPRAVGPVRAEIRLASQVFPPDGAGYFTTCFHRGTTTYGRDWLFLESPGTGWFLGAVQSMQGEHYCEGDEHFYLDGAVSPQIHGTGSEDYYLGCFWPNLNYNSPFANCVGDIQEEGGGTFEGSYAVPSCYSRFHLEAPIPFFNRIDARIQHGGFDTISSRYASLAFSYLRGRPALVQTDSIDIGSPAGEAAHGYKADSSRPYGPIAASGSAGDSTRVSLGRRRMSTSTEICPAPGTIRTTMSTSAGSTPISTSIRGSRRGKIG